VRKLRSGKYKAVKTNGYASKKEARRAQELHLLEKAGEIFFLRQQVKFELLPKQEGERAVHYVADFVYSVPQARTIVEDVKGIKTRDYIIKRKLMLYVHGIRIKEV